MAKRLYISVDNEGVGGVTSGCDEGRPGGFAYETMREWMTGEALAAVEAARAWGVDDIVVSDSHGNGQNLLLDRFPGDGVTIVRSWPRPYGMVDGIETGAFLGAALIGYHESNMALEGVLRHTLDDLFQEIRLNGRIASETMLAAAVAGHFGVPVVMVSGDEAYTRHAKALLGDVETVTTKWARGFSSVRTHTPARCRELIAQAMSAALDRVSEFEPFTIEGPIELEVQFHDLAITEICDYLPGVERSAPRKIRSTLEDIVAVTRFLTFLMEYSPNAKN